MFRRLDDSAIATFLVEGIPSDDGSECSSGSNEDCEIDQRLPMLLGNELEVLVAPRSPMSDLDDDVPLSNLVGTRNESSVSTSSALRVSHAPKWKRHYKMNLPGKFDEHVGVSECIRSLENITPLILFRKFWSEDLQEILSFQTNLYANQKGKSYSPTTPEEMDVFIALNLVMGLKKLPSYKDYWSSAPDLHDSYISAFMPLKRFSWLLNNLHINDNNLIPPISNLNYDKQYKLRPLLDIMQRNFRQNYRPTENIAIDESMIKFKGRSYMKQYMPKKPVKRGYKVWMKCADSGYCLEFEIYIGKVGNIVETDLGGRVVRQFCDDLKGKNHKVYFDNYFNSYQLQVDLLQDNIYACGTVNSNRKLLPKLKDDHKMHRGEHDYRISDTNVGILKWKDKRSVYLLSNFHDPTKTAIVSRRERNGDLQEVSCPEAVVDYNANMNYVDKFDQLKGSYAVDRKSKKWWHRIFFHFLDCSVVNAFLVYKEIQKEQRPDLDQLVLKEFRRAVYQGLLAPAYVNRRRPNSVLTNQSGASSPRPVIIKKSKPSVPEEIRLESSRHQPERGTSRRCCKCSTKKAPARTVWQCSICKVPLCIKKNKSCFKDFHKNN